MLQIVRDEENFENSLCSGAFQSSTCPAREWRGRIGQGQEDTVSEEELRIVTISPTGFPGCVAGLLEKHADFFKATEFYLKLC